MSIQPEYIRLCRLLDDTLRPFSHLDAESLTQETEKKLLVALSQAFKQVEQWTHQFDFQSNFDTDKELLELCNNEEPFVSTTSYSDNSHCLAKIIGDLMFLFSVNDPCVRHLGGNALLTISKFVIASGSSWDTFIHLLCIFLELATIGTLSSSHQASELAKKYSNYGLLIQNWLPMSEPGSSKWSVVTAMIQVLRNILKYLKQDCDGETMKTYVESVCSLLLNVPWDFLSEIVVDCDAETLRGSDKDASLHIKLVHPREMEMLCGSLLQFLCSFIDQIDYAEDGVGFFADICQMNDLILKLMDWCHVQLQGLENISIIQYSRHKMLMLMVKLSSRRHAKDTMWIHLVHKYFEDLLLQPLSGCELNENSSLEGSPFCSSISDPEKSYTTSRHLQRLAVFIFLKSSLNLVSSKENSNGLPHEDMWHYLNSDVNVDPEHCTKCQGLSELQRWLEGHIPADTFMNHKLHLERCMRFTRAFLKLYMHEDDVLFEMLLQFFCLPIYPKHEFTGVGARFTAENHGFFLASLLFNPIHLFHLFLAEILYDHQVLLDYLISRDSGSKCAEYILRSLRLVCNSWDLFLEFPDEKEGLGRSNSKRQKVLVDNSTFKAVSSLENVETSVSCSLEKEHKKKRPPLLAARDCLISLRKSIESLTQKNLFPYNPQVILKRLLQFEELCSSSDKF